MQFQTLRAVDCTPETLSVCLSRQLVTLASIHVVVYTMLGLLLPWLYLYPTADLFLCMRRPLFNDILSREEFSTPEWVITFVSVVFLIPVLWLLMLWHVVMALSLFRLLVRKVGPRLPMLCAAISPDDGHADVASLEAGQDKSDAFTTCLLD